MARRPRDYRIEKRDARLKLPHQHEPYWRSVTEGLAIGYRRTKDGNGTWIARRRLELAGKRSYKKMKLGLADDFKKADGQRVLDYSQALDKAWNFDDTKIETEHGITVRGSYNIRQCMEEYLTWYRVNRTSIQQTESVVSQIILPYWKELPVSELTSYKIESWMRHLVETPPKRGQGRSGTVIKEAPSPDKSEYPEFLRRRQQTANRIYGVLRAALNRGWRKGRIESQEAWLKVEPFKKVTSARQRFLSEAEIKKLLAACEPAFRKLCQAAILTGCRMGELAALRVEDFDKLSGTLHIRRSKTGLQRHIPLTLEGQQFFLSLTVGRKHDETMLLKRNNTPWARWEQKWPLNRAIKTSGIQPLTFHELRHTYASLLAKNGTPLQVIAQALGHTSTRMAEQHYAHLCKNYFAETVRANLPEFGIETGNVIDIGLRKEHDGKR